MKQTYQVKPIGVIRSPYKNLREAPRQGKLCETLCEIEVYPEYMEGLEGIEAYRHLIILYWMHRSQRDKVKARPPNAEGERGVFSTRSPDRPNPIGLCLTELVAVEENRLKVRWLDALDGSPLLDMKPYQAEIDSP
ncbi:TPA: tRNA (N6-threonylcarbamoyladenosine(37)-N6)-methyltransferase TrmO [Candidatus Bathyarchaeota archaeon]|nr:tRNA (N6-threonylcarbamoyladenosine(37)-N6)-methyltransferase TrmO [Candidatus Bathyarchaeota archaeon]